MESLPHIITDLAYILVVAGLVTIIFKRLRQPLVLGYIVAGFLAGPHMTYMPSVSSTESIGEWSEIGVIFLMFALGLEFSFKRIVRMGMQPIITTLCVMFSMMSVGTLVGHVFGWASMDRIFLGGMLAMSSTTIIYKAFDDLGLRSQRFASGVLSTLILEDIFGILLMVMLSAVAVSKQLQGMQLVQSFLSLGFFLVLWFTMGILIVPLFLRKFKKYINAETLLIISVGLCFLLVVIAAKAGYSPAFGAFMMGSILSETMESERIEQTMMPLRNLFGAIFFVSVGMLVDPQVLLTYWPAILGITLVVIVGQMIFGTVSFIVGGSTLRDAMRSGFSLVQIGEFAFIIAALGESLGVTSSFLYPVVVAVSIITTFFTPYIIRMADPVYVRLEKMLPTYLRTHVLERRNKSVRSSKRQTKAMLWNGFLADVLVQTVAYLTLCIAFSSFFLAFIRPLCSYLMGERWGSVVTLVLSLLFLASSIRPIMIRKNRTQNVRTLRAMGGVQVKLVNLVIALKMMVGYYIVFYMVQTLSPLSVWLNLLIALGATFVIATSKWVKFNSIKLERVFKQNLRFKDTHEESHRPTYSRSLRGKDIRIVKLTVPLHSLWSGKSLSKLHFNGVNVVAIERGGKRTNIPGPSNVIYSGDTLEVVGDESSISTFRQMMNVNVRSEEAYSDEEARLSVQSFRLSSASVFTGRTMIELNMRAKYNCLVIGVEDAQGHIQKPQPKVPFQTGDTLWIVGEPADLSIIRMCV